MPRWRKRVPRAKRRRSGYRADMKVENLMNHAVALKRLIDATPPGVPSISGTGPQGTVCGQCNFYGYDLHPNSCHRYLEVVSQHGAALPVETPSCRHFARRWPGRNEILRR
jgi:hypothetical protein